MKRTAAVASMVAILFSGCGSQALPVATPSALTSPSSVTADVPTAPASVRPTESPHSVRAVGTWTTTGSMVAARADFTATLLPDGKVLVAGGVDSNDDRTQKALASAELFDPGTGKWSATGSMTTPRSRHTATLLRNGTVLVAGGYCPRSTTKGCPSVFDPDGAIAAAELYDPRTGTWSATGSMTTTRFLHSATLLADGRVLVAGAEHGMPDAILASTELYDPATGRWSATGSMITARTQQFAAMLRDGKVLVAGGIGPVSPTKHDLLVSAELYDADTGKWTATGSLSTPRAEGGTAVLLGDGKVIVAGGDGPGDPMLASAELYDPGGGVWMATGSMSGPRGQSASVLLADGQVLVAGGFDVGNETGRLLASAERFDPNTGIWSNAGSVAVPRFDPTATLLDNGKVLVAGGLLADGVTSSADLYDPAAGS